MNKKERDDIRARLSDKRSLQPKNTSLCGLIALNPKITSANYIASLVHTLVLGFLVNGVELIQQNLLVHPNYYNYDSEKAIRYNSLITSEDLVLKIIATPFFGVMVDRYGRQKMLFIAYFFIIVSLALFPVMYYSPYFSSLGWYFGVRFIYSMGSAIVPILPFVADFVDKSTTGRAIGLSCLFISLGFTVSTYTVTLLSKYDPFYTYMVYAGFILVVGTIYSLFLKSGNSYYKTPRSSFDVETGHHLIGAHINPSTKNRRISMVKKDCKTKPWIVVSYIFAFLNGVGLATMSQLLNLYVQSFDKHNGGGAAAGSKVVFQANIASLVTSTILGPSLDLVKPIYIGFLAIVSSLFSYGSVWAVKDPEDLLMTLVAIGIGVSYSCSLLLAKYLGFKNYRTSIRGLLFSIANILIMLGVIFIAVVGGNLFQIDRNIPFYIGVGISFICSVVFLYMYFGSIRKLEKTQPNGRITTPMIKAPSIVFVMEDEVLDADAQLEAEADALDQEQDDLDQNWEREGGNEQSTGQKDISGEQEYIKNRVSE